MSRLTRGLKSGSRDRVYALLSICSLQLHKGTLNTFVTLPGRTGIVWILTMVKATQDGRMGKRLQCIYISTFILQMGKLRSRGDLDLPKIKGKDLAGVGGIKNARPKLLALERFSLHLSPCAIEAFTKFI